MALVQRKLSKAKQLKLAGSLIGIIVITLAVAYYGLIKPRRPQPQDELLVPISLSPALRSGIPSQTGFDAAQELNTLPLFQALRSFGQWPLSVEPKGNRAPFTVKQQ